MNIEISVPEVVELIKEIQGKPGRIFEIIGMNVQKDVGKYLTNLMKGELTHFLGREEYERTEGETNHRNGDYPRKFCIKGIAEDLSLMYLTGISTRTLSMLSRRLIGRSISHGEISKVNTELSEAIEQWRNRDLSGEKIKYLFIDGVIFKMRIEGTIENVPVLVAIGVREDGIKLVLGLQSGDKESATNWREFFRDLKGRGFNGSGVRLGIMDGLSGLEKVFKEEFPNAQVQRCQVHVARNVIAKVPRKLRKEVADDLRSIFYASAKEKANTFYKAFQEKWNKEIPSAVKSLEHSIDSCLTFFHFPEEEWTSLRTTNIVERLNKEFKRRTKSMEIVAGENACYRLLTFISLKMELGWRANAVGKVRPNLPLYQIYTK